MNRKGFAEHSPTPLDGSYTQPQPPQGNSFASPEGKTTGERHRKRPTGNYGRFSSPSENRAPACESQAEGNGFVHRQSEVGKQRYTGSPKGEQDTSLAENEQNPRFSAMRNKVYKTLPQPPPKKFDEIRRPKRKALPDGTEHHRRAAFAAMGSLAPRLRKAGLHPDRLWRMFKAEYHVDSRSKFTEKQWAICAARLNMFRFEPHMFALLVERLT